MTELVVDWCSYKAAKYAVMNWHYSKRMPMGKLVKVGAWEEGVFIGCVLFSSGSSRFYGIPFGLDMLEVSELARVSLSAHKARTSKVVATGIQMLKRQSPELRLIVSFADPSVGHNGTLYQAGNWLYCGRGTSDTSVRRYQWPDGRVWQWRSMARYLNSRGLEESVKQALALGVEPLETEPKHKYLYPLDRAMRRQIAPLAKPYPKRCGQGVTGDTSDNQSEGAGSIPAVRSDHTGQTPAVIA